MVCAMHRNLMLNWREDHYKIVDNHGIVPIISVGAKTNRWND